MTVFLNQIKYQRARAAMNLIGIPDDEEAILKEYLRLGGRIEGEPTGVVEIAPVVETEVFIMTDEPEIVGVVISATEPEPVKEIVQVVPKKRRTIKSVVKKVIKAVKKGKKK